MYLNFEIEGEKQLSRRLRRISDDLKSFRSEMQEAGQYLVGEFSGPVFESRGKEIGEPWKSRKQSYPWPILEKTGKMRRSFRHTARATSVEIYNTTDYFKYHQSRKPRKKLPRRVMMKLDQERKTGIVKIFHRNLL